MPRSQPFISVADVMTRQVRSAEASQGLGEIWRILVDEGCHHVPIVDGGKPVGMIAARDLVCAAQERGSHRSGSSDVAPGLPKNVSAGEVMSTQLVTIQSDAPIDGAIDRIGRGDIHALVVLDENANLAGIVTNHDLLHYLAD